MTAVASFWVACPSCSTEFEVDPAKVPADGVHAICSSCARTFMVALPDVLATPNVAAGEAWMPEAPEGLEEETAEDPVEDVPEPLEAVTEAASPVQDDPPVEAPPQFAPPQFEDLSGFVSDASVEEDEDPKENVLGKTLSEGANRFGRRDPGERARRLARVLVSDIIAYHPERYRAALAAGTLKEELADEVDRSWEEFVQQVGLELAESTPYFTEALNEVLAKGDEVF